VASTTIRRTTPCQQRIASTRCMACELNHINLIEAERLDDKTALVCACLSGRLHGNLINFSSTFQVLSPPRSQNATARSRVIAVRSLSPPIVHSPTWGLVGRTFESYRKNEVGTFGGLRLCHRFDGGLLSLTFAPELALHFSSYNYCHKWSSWALPLERAVDSLSNDRNVFPPKASRGSLTCIRS